MRRLAALAMRGWTRRGVTGLAVWAALVPSAVLYGIAARARNFLYDHGLRRPARVNVPVISVGNLTVGGTGKTPVALWLADELGRRGARVGILSRGYGRRSHGVRVIAERGRCLLDVAEAGDEPTVLGRRLHDGVVVVGERRAAAAAVAIERGADVLVLDDGFQHRGLARDFDLLLIDATRQFANGWTLPAGPLREPQRGALRASAVGLVERGVARPESPVAGRRVAAMVTAKPCFRMRLEARGLVIPGGDGWTEAPLGGLAGQRVLTVSGIGDVESFYAMLRRWEARIVDAIEFPDHHRYDRQDWRTITVAARQADLIVTTEKDLVKLEQFPFSKGSIVGLRLGLQVDDAATLLEAVCAAIEKVRAR